MAVRYSASERWRNSHSTSSFAFCGGQLGHFGQDAFSFGIQDKMLFLGQWGLVAFCRGQFWTRCFFWAFETRYSFWDNEDLLPFWGYLRSDAYFVTIRIWYCLRLVLTYETIIITNITTITTCETTIMPNVCALARSRLSLSCNSKVKMSQMKT